MNQSIHTNLYLKVEDDGRYGDGDAERWLCSVLTAIRETLSVSECSFPAECNVLIQQ